MPVIASPPLPENLSALRPSGTEVDALRYRFDTETMDMSPFPLARVSDGEREYFIKPVSAIESATHLSSQEQLGPQNIIRYAKAREINPGDLPEGLREYYADLGERRLLLIEKVPMESGSINSLVGQGNDASLNEAMQRSLRGVPVSAAEQRQIASELEGLAKNGLVHGDLPANISLQRGEDGKLTMYVIDPWPEKAAGNMARDVEDMRGMFADMQKAGAAEAASTVRGMQPSPVSGTGPSPQTLEERFTGNYPLRYESMSQQQAPFSFIQNDRGEKFTILHRDGWQEIVPDSFLTKDDFKPEKQYVGKFHISVADEDVGKAWNLIADDLVNSNVQAKVRTESGIARVNGNPDSAMSGKTIVVYIAGDEMENSAKWEKLIGTIENKFRENGIRKGPDVTSELAIDNAKYTTRRWGDTDYDTKNTKVLNSPLRSDGTDPLEGMKLQSPKRSISEQELAAEQRAYADDYAKRNPGKEPNFITEQQAEARIRKREANPDAFDAKGKPITGRSERTSDSMTAQIADIESQIDSERDPVKREQLEEKSTKLKLALNQGKASRSTFENNRAVMAEERETAQAERDKAYIEGAESGKIRPFDRDQYLGAAMREASRNLQNEYIGNERLYTGDDNQLNALKQAAQVQGITLSEEETIDGKRALLVREKDMPKFNDSMAKGTFEPEATATAVQSPVAPVEPPQPVAAPKPPAAEQRRSPPRPPGIPRNNTVATPSPAVEKPPVNSNVQQAAADQSPAKPNAFRDFVHLTDTEGFSHMPGRCVATKLLRDPGLANGVQGVLNDLGVADNMIGIGEGRQKLSFGLVRDASLYPMNETFFSQLAQHPPEHVLSVLPVNEYVLSAKTPVHADSSLPPAMAVLVKSDGTSTMLNSVADLPEALRSPSMLSKDHVIVMVTPYVVEQGMLESAGLSPERANAIRAHNEKHFNGKFTHGDGAPQWGITPADLMKSIKDPNYMPQPHLYDLGDMQPAKVATPEEMAAGLQKKESQFPIYKGDRNEKIQFIQESLGIKNAAQAAPELRTDAPVQKPAAAMAKPPLGTAAGDKAYLQGIQDADSKGQPIRFNKKDLEGAQFREAVRGSEMRTTSWKLREFTGSDANLDTIRDTLQSKGIEVEDVIDGGKRSLLVDPVTMSAAQKTQFNEMMPVQENAPEVAAAGARRSDNARSPNSRGDFKGSGRDGSVNGVQMRNREGKTLDEIRWEQQQAAKRAAPEAELPSQAPKAPAIDTPDVKPVAEPQAPAPRAAAPQARMAGNSVAAAMDIKSLITDDNKSMAGASLAINSGAIVTDLLQQRGVQVGNAVPILSYGGYALTAARLGADYMMIDAVGGRDATEQKGALLGSFALGAGSGAAIAGLGGTAAMTSAAGALGLGTFAASAVASAGTTVAIAAVTTGTMYAINSADKALFGSEDNRFTANADGRNMTMLANRYADLAKSGSSEVGGYAKELVDPKTGKIDLNNMETLSKLATLLENDLKNDKYGAEKKEEDTSSYLARPLRAVVPNETLNRNNSIRSDIQIIEAAQAEVKMRMEQLRVTGLIMKLGKDGKAPTLEDLDRNKDGKLTTEDYNAIKDVLGGDEKLTKSYIDQVGKGLGRSLPFKGETMQRVLEESLIVSMEKTNPQIGRQLRGEQEMRDFDMDGDGKLTQNDRRIIMKKTGFDDEYLKEYTDEIAQKAGVKINFSGESMASLQQQSRLSTLEKTDPAAAREMRDGMKIVDMVKRLSDPEGNMVLGKDGIEGVIAKLPDEDKPYAAQLRAALEKQTGGQQQAAAKTEPEKTEPAPKQAAKAEAPATDKKPDALSAMGDMFNKLRDNPTIAAAMDAMASLGSEGRVSFNPGAAPLQASLPKDVSAKGRGYT